MRLTGLVIALFVGIFLPATMVAAELKAVFAFNDRVISIRFPGLNYGIVTTVDWSGRQIAVTFPRAETDSWKEAPALHLEISLEPIDASVDGQEYFQHYLGKYTEAMGSTLAPVENVVPNALLLLDCKMTFLYFSDREMRLHKALLITSIDEGTGVVILLDSLAASYDANEGVSIGILESIHFEN